MKTFNVMGDCVSRDILNVGGVKVLQYHAFSSPLSICSEKSGYVMLLDDLNNDVGKGYSGFVKRCIMFDFNKSMLDYVFAKRSDYFVLDILDARHPLLIKGNHCITMTKRLEKIKPLIPDYLGMDKYEEKSPFTDISIEQWRGCISKLVDEIRMHYVDNQIILNVHYGVKQYMTKSGINKFSAPIVNNVEQYNALVEKLFRMLREELEGCHVIEFPDNVMAVAGHRWGLAPLHYHDIYYSYGADAIKIILHDLSDEEEKEQLEQLRVNYSERFELLNTKKELEVTQRKLRWFRNALKFAEFHAYDFYGDGKFPRWLSDCRNENKRIAVLKSGCAAGRILLKGLEKYGIDVIFSTENAGFDECQRSNSHFARKQIL